MVRRRDGRLDARRLSQRVLGAIVFRKRIAGVFVSVITLALVLLVRLVIIDAQPVTNGFNGLTDLGTFQSAVSISTPIPRATYYLVAISLILALVGARLLVETRAGLILQAIRDDQNRARYLGFDVPVYQVFFFTVSAAISGVAGMLYVIVAEFASPTFMDLSFSITMVVWAALGGRSSLLGACIGAILINIIAAGVSETQDVRRGLEGDHRPRLRLGRALSAARTGRFGQDWPMRWRPAWHGGKIQPRQLQVYGRPGAARHDRRAHR